MVRSASLAATLCLATLAAQASPVSGQGTWETTLRGRAPLTPGGTDYQAYYDTELNITWVANGNLANDPIYISTRSNWAESHDYIDSLNAQDDGRGYLGVNDWRLPAIGPVNGSTMNYSPSHIGTTDYGFNVSAPGTLYAGSTSSELAHLFYNTLANKGYCDPVLSNVYSCPGYQPGWGLSNTGPFSNVRDSNYWFGAEFEPYPRHAWYFYFSTGLQWDDEKSSVAYVWPVRSGDIALDVLDSDGDGVADYLDNCKLVANPTQLDADHDGYGNICDADLNNSGLVTAQDTTNLRNVLNQPASASLSAAKSDLNGSGFVTVQDYTILRNRLNTAPGPSGLACAGTIPCP